jgi:Type VI secretion system, TssO
MEPKNKTERKKAFYSFLLLFFVSTAIIILLAFSSTRVPVKVNSLLQKQVEVSDHEREFSINFLSQMTGIVSLLDTINTTASSNADLIDGQISMGIQKLTILIDMDSVQNKDLYRSVVLNLSDLQRAKKQLRKSTEGDTDINALKRENENLENKLDECKNKNDLLQIQLIQASKR